MPVPTDHPHTTERNDRPFLTRLYPIIHTELYQLAEVMFAASLALAVYHFRQINNHK
jgi:hypothetical protein